MSEWIETHMPCPWCGSSDALSHGIIDGKEMRKCFSCGKAELVKGEPMDTETKGEVIDIPSRKIRRDTCAKYGVRHKDYRIYFPYYRDRQLVAQKHVGTNKDFRWSGDGKNPQFFGQQLFNATKLLIVTEGEYDCLSVSQVFDNRYSVVSLPTGATSAVGVFKQNLKWLESFKKVVIMFDMDAAGEKAAQECARVLSHNKAFIAHLPLKDANECLKAGMVKDIINGVNNSKPFKPDGIISRDDIWKQLIEHRTVQSIDYPWEELNKKTRGMRRGELVTFTAGSGVGKSAICREIAHHLITSGENVGLIFLEEDVRRTSEGIMGVELNKVIHTDIRNYEDLSKEEMEERREAYVKLFDNDRVYILDHFGSTEIDTIYNHVAYLAESLDVKWVILDHLSIIISGMEAENERQVIDNIMTRLRTLVQKTHIGLILVSHLRRPEGNRGHEEGAKISMSQLRGSHSIAQLSDMVIGAERNLQAENPDEENITTLRVMKNRFSGVTGGAGHLEYDLYTGRLMETEGEF